jgi:hypothetical protein
VCSCTNCASSCWQFFRRFTVPRHHRRQTAHLDLFVQKVLFFISLQSRPISKAISPLPLHFFLVFIPRSPSSFSSPSFNFHLLQCFFCNFFILISYFFRDYYLYLAVCSRRIQPLLFSSRQTACLILHNHLANLLGDSRWTPMAYLVEIGHDLSPSVPPYIITFSALFA